MECLSYGGRPQITEWLLSLSPAVQAVFDDRIGFLGIHPRKDWQFPEFRVLRGREGKYGLSEIRWQEDGVQWRVLGFFGTQEMQYTLLVGCSHKQNRYTPSDSLDTAIKRKKEIERSERTVRIYEYE
jgi:hypothetical protein